MTKAHNEEKEQLENEKKQLENEKKQLEEKNLLLQISLEKA